ncbi:MAG: hypothetical protein Q7R56_01850, partial [Nanoarchaeota archaeon]|nr:hypothetical protein [Nanoarchaeota archaeon]
SCADGLQNQDEAGVDCGGLCSACVVDVDGDSLTDEQESLLGTSVLLADSDHDGVDDASDILPLCPNSVCDLNFGESSDNCPLDCPKQKSFGIFYAVGVFGFVLLLVIVFLMRVMRRPVNSKMVGVRKERSVEPTVVEVKEVKMKERASSMDKSLEKSFARAAELLKKK